MAIGSTTVRDRYGVRPSYRRIRLKKQKAKESTLIQEEHKLSPVAARVLAARGFTTNQILKNFLQPTLREGLPDPKTLKNLDAACALIKEIVELKKPIAICCDFDVDGLSGGAQVYHFLKNIGAETQVFVPDRFTEGYGLNERTVKKIAEAKFGLLITIDFGTTNEKELSLAKKLGLKTIVIDHHFCGNHTPPADVFINPNQKGCGFADKVLSASGLAWFLIVGLIKKLTIDKKIDPRSYLDLACLGTICDMVPLTGVNRIIAKKGLELLDRTKRVGLNALKDVIGIKNGVSCTDVSFGIGPRLNAAGRMVHGEVVIDLLSTDDTEQSAKLARQLNRLNLERQETENKVKEIAVERVREKRELPPGILVWDREFHTGVIGIVAQRLVETFYRPSAVLGVDTNGVFKGSMRGIRGMSVIETLNSLGEHLIKYGGHEGAGGFSIEESRIEDFSVAFEEECARRLEGIETDPYAEADTEADLMDITFDLIDELSGFAPFGMGNPNPLILIKDLKVHEVKVLKSMHLKAIFTDGKIYVPGLLWRQSSHPALIAGTKVNVVARVESSSFNGRNEVQLNLQAVEKI